MTRKFTIFTVSILVLLVAASAFAAQAPKYKMGQVWRPTDAPARLAGGSEELGAAPTGRIFGNSYSVGTSASPGTQIGMTYYDYQHNGSTGFGVGKFGSTVQGSFMDQNTAVIAPGRLVKWNKAIITGSPANFALDNGDIVSRLPLGSVPTPDGTPMTEDQAGYTTMSVRANGKGVVFYHAVGATGSWLAAVDQSIGNGLFTGNTAPQPNGGIDTLIWPHGTVDVVGSDTVIHCVARGSMTQGDRIYNPIHYWRGVISGGTVTWGTPVFFDTAATISQVVAADPSSDEVAAVYTRTINPAYTGGTAQRFNHLVVRKSTNGGLTWGAPSFIHQQDTLAAGSFPYTDVAANYDDGGVLHVVYNASIWREDAGELSLFFSETNLYHWNDVRGTSRLINQLTTNNTCSQTGPFDWGAWNLNMMKPNLTVKPAGANGIADEVLYAVWVQSGPTTTDCAKQDSTVTIGGSVNTEIFCSASSDDGLTWDRPVNITGTETPNCNAGNCHSEHWVSTAPRADSGIYLSYVDDTHAGGIVQGEGVWTESPFMLYAVETRTPVSSPRIAASPVSHLELQLKPESTKTVSLTITNLGNASLSYTVNVTNDDGGLSHVQVNGGPSHASSIAAAGAPHVLTISYDGVGLPNPSEHDWRLEVTSNDSTNNPGVGGTAIDVMLNVFVADPWFTCTYDTISTGQHRLTVGSCLEIGDQADRGGFFKYSDSSDWMFDASPVVARQSGPDKFAWVNVHFDGVADRSRDSNESYRAQSAISVFRNGSGTDSAKGIAYTTDSNIQLNWRARAFDSPASARNGFVMNYTVTNISGGSLSGLHLGAAADVDVDSSSSANDGIANSTKMYVGARGGYLQGDTAGGIFVPQNHYAALFFQALDGACTEVGAGGQVLNNVDYLYEESEYNTDSLYDWMNDIVAWGSATVSADTPTDVNVVLVNKKSVSLANNASTTFAFGFAQSDVSVAELESRIAALRQAANPACVACPILLTGDVNNNGSITSADIIYLVGYVFKGGPPPQPCVAAADVNCNGSVTSADIIYLVGYVFKGGPAPCDACTSAAPC